jgi:hypothetical protein
MKMRLRNRMMKLIEKNMEKKASETKKDKVIGYDPSGFVNIYEINSDNVIWESNGMHVSPIETEVLEGGEEKKYFDAASEELKSKLAEDEKKMFRVYLSEIEFI